MKKIDLTNVQESTEGKSLVAGAYVCRYLHVDDKPDKEYLYMEYDIVEGEFKDYWKNTKERLNADWWGGKVYRSYKPKAQPMFKRMCSAVSKSNGSFVFDGSTNPDEKTLEGKLVGLVIGMEEYMSNSGDVKQRPYVARECSVEDARSGKMKIPALKKLKDDDAASTTSAAESTDFVNISPAGLNIEVPFN